MARPSARIRHRLTRQGWIVGALAWAVGCVAAISGNNLLFMVVAVQVALLAVAALLGSWNLRALTAHRRLPPELFAGLSGRGRLVVENRRRWLGSNEILVEDVAAGASAVIPRITPSSEGSAQVLWRFLDRGTVRLGPLRLSSTFPFGLTEHRVELPRAAELVVYPRPARAGLLATGGDDSGERDAPRGRGSGGELRGLRVYRPGDRIASIHWPTTARTDEVMVVQRVGEADPVVDIRVRALPGPGWEQELERAAGRVVLATAQGHRVGLVLPAVGDAPGMRLRPDIGARWRRVLLDALARAPRLEPAR